MLFGIHGTYIKMETIKGLDAYLTREPDLLECTCKFTVCKDYHCPCECCNAEGNHLGHNKKCPFPSEICECQELNKEDWGFASDKACEDRGEDEG